MALYSLYLVWRLDGRKTPLGRWATVQYFVAWFVSAAVVLLWVMLLAPVLASSSTVINDLSRFLDPSGMNPMGMWP